MKGTLVMQDGTVKPFASYPNWWSCNDVIWAQWVASKNVKPEDMEMVYEHGLNFVLLGEAPCGYMAASPIEDDIHEHANY